MPRRKPTTNNVVQLPVADPVFFHKGDLFVGATLTYYGRHDPGCRWRVERIMEYSMVKGQWRGKAVSRPETLMAEVWLVRETDTTRKDITSSDHMQLNFQYLSYSSIWRITP